MNLVIVFSAFNSSDAQLVRARLEAANFHAIVTNEMSALTPAFFSTAGTVHVQVPEDEAADAKELLAAGEA